MKTRILLSLMLVFSMQLFAQQPPVRKSDLRVMFDYEKTKDPATGDIPKERLVKAKEKAKSFKLDKRKTQGTSTISLENPMISAVSLAWTERGPYADAVGPSNGNTRANSAVSAGRVRAIWPDLADATGKTVWAAGVDGGLWKTTDITVSPANWSPVDDDQFDNLAITSIAQDPTNNNILYAATGESFMSLAGGKPSINAVKGVGVYKSIDHGVSWSLLTSTSTGAFVYCTKIVCGSNGYVYLATRMVLNAANAITHLGALRRSTDAGASWTDITPNVTILPNPQYAGTTLAGYSSGQIGAISDIEISSTGRMHVVSGMMGYAQYYAYTDNPSTVSSSTGWANAATPFSNYSTSTTYVHRTELAVKGDTLYALPVREVTRNADTIWRSTNGGVNWSPTAGQISGLTNGQAYYDLAVAINPVNAKECIVGGLDNWKTTDGGATWIKISDWVDPTGQYVHADQHNIVWYNAGNKLLFTSDGGVFYSADKGTTIRDRNSGLNIKQFYSTAIHPISTNYMLAGAQDNGTHQLNSAGLAASVEVLGGDGGFVAIDQTDPQFQFGTYIYGAFRRSTNSGSNWSSIQFYKGSNSLASYMGLFINPYALDDSTETIYAGAGTGEFFRWTTATTAASGTYFLSGTPSFPAGANIITGVTAFGGGQVSAVKISPYKLNRVIFGTNTGKIVRVDSANTAATSNPSVVDITGSGMPTGSVFVSSINVGTNDSNLIACFSNYGVNNIWISRNAGTSWATIDGDLADIPVRWVMFYPGDDTRAIIATETGVWTTDLIDSNRTAWRTDASFPTVRTDMLTYRSADRTLVAATHGRGLWTTTLPDLNCVPAAPANITTTLVSDVCGARVYRYTAPALNGTATGWQWSFVGTLGTNATVDSGSLTSQTVKMKYTSNNAATTGDSARVAYSSGCGNSLNRSTILTNTALGVSTAPASISITSVRDTCGGRIYRYAAPALTTAATGWQWSFTNSTLGNNATVDSGSLTSQVVRIKYTLNTAAAAGDSARVAYTSACGNGANRTALLTNTALAAPAAPASLTITLVDNTCGARVYRYAAPALSGTATGWLWSFVGTLGTNAQVDSGTLTSQVVRMKYTSNNAAVTGDSARVAYTSGCGSSPRRAALLTNLAFAAPTAPTSITTTMVSNTCGARVYRYAAPALSGTATGWLWSFVGTLGTNATVDSGSLTSQVVKMKYTLNTAASTGDSARVAYTTACANSTNRSALLTNTSLAPAAPASINITSVRDTCGGRIYRYTAPALITGASGWQWSFTSTTLGNNASVDSGTLTSQVIKVKFTLNSAAVAGDSVRVLYTSVCGNSINRSNLLSNTALAAPAAPASITITSVRDTCGGRIYRYAAPALTGTATGYQWSFVGTLYSTASIDSGTLTSQKLRLKFSSNSAAGTDSARVAYTSGCGSSPRRALKLTNTALAAPVAPASITITSVRDTCGGRIYRYTTPAISGTATGYQWSFVGTIGSVGTVDSGSLTSQILRVKFTSNLAAGTDSARVAYTSGCGTSPRRALKLTNTLLAAPATAPVAPVITLVSTTGCTRVYRYSTTSTLTGTATGYLWSFVGTLGTTAVLDSGTLTSRVVRMSFTSSIAAGTDSARVLFTSGCGNSPIAKTKLTNTTLICTPLTEGIANNSLGSIMEGSLKVKVYPNPSNGLFNVQVQSAEKETVQIKVVDMQGRVLKVMKTTPYKTNWIGSDLRNGVYFIEVTQGKQKTSAMVLKQ